MPADLPLTAAAARADQAWRAAMLQTASELQARRQIATGLVAELLLSGLWLSARLRQAGCPASETGRIVRLHHTYCGIIWARLWAQSGGIGPPDPMEMPDHIPWEAAQALTSAMNSSPEVSDDD